MLVSRIAISIVLVPIGLLVMAYGGIPYALVILLLMGLAAWEYARLFRAGGFQPSGALTAAGALLLVAGRAWNGFESAGWLLALLVMAAMTYHLFAYERGRDQAGSDFAITLAGVLYFGWLGGYLISLRALPEGQWWLLTALPAVWLADSGAYFIGSRFGRRSFSPRLSPKKTWEGYFGGVLFGALGGGLLALLWRVGAGSASQLTFASGALLGLALAVITPLGDLGESMIKRQVKVKDSSHLIPGHGGVFDRVDSWLWAGALAYYFIVWLL
ncbi:MAG: phosphatidate cytidylyltransferase [Chloroflexi bacterium]|nr:phosphatidate cytidylyltransferase [Chloroflexota bacterium]